MEVLLEVDLTNILCVLILAVCDLHLASGHDAQLPPESYDIETSDFARACRCLLGHFHGRTGDIDDHHILDELYQWNCDTSAETVARAR